MKNRTILLVGASGDIGSAILVELNNLNLTVYATFNKSWGKLDKFLTGEAVETKNIHPIKVDFSKQSEVVSFWGQNRGKLKFVDTLIWTTAISSTHLEKQNNFTRWQDVININTFQPYEATLNLLKENLKEVIFISSIAGDTGLGSTPEYSASKAALNVLVKYLARTYKLKVNAIAPGPVEGRWLQTILGDSYTNTIKDLERRTPLNRICRPVDIAKTVNMLLECEMINGQIITCDGGLTC